jgi:hypothetical protein
MAKVRVEWVRLTHADFERGGEGGLASVAGAQTLTVGGTAVLSAPAPTFAGEGQTGFARVSGLAGAVNIAWGGAPIASETNGVRLEAGAQTLIAVVTGQSLSFIEAADAATTQGVQTLPLQGEAVARSGAIATGGTAQDLMPANASRRGWRLQNQSGADLYVVSKGPSGANVAVMDASSLRIAPSVIWTEDGPVTTAALSIIGSATGQTFYAREW